MKSWPSSGPDKIWMNEDGGLGYAGFSVSNGGLYTMGAFGNTEKLLAFNASTGKKVWELPIGDLLTNGWGDGPRTTPSVSDGKVYALGGKGNLVCADSRTGQKIWETHLVKDLGGKVPGWGYTESVLVDEGRVICTPGGSGGALSALDANTGKVLWRPRNLRNLPSIPLPSLLHKEVNGNMFNS